MGLLTAGAVVAKVATGQMVTNALDSAISTLFNAVKSGKSISSLADASRPFRVEPLTIVDQTLANQPFTEDIMKMCLTQFSAYYMQAFTALVGINSIQTLKTFDSLNPNRSIGVTQDVLIKSKGIENFDGGLPTLDEMEGTPVERGLLAEYSVSNESTGGVDTASARTDKFYEVENLSVGKLINVEIKNATENAKVPILIRLVPAAVRPDVVTHIFTMGGRESFGERFELARAGMIRPIRDLIFGIDILDAHRNTLVNDKSGVYKMITDRRRNNVVKAAASGVVSAADASNIAVISAETARGIAKKMYGKLDSIAVRQRLFDNSYLLLLVVVDERNELVTVYHRGLEHSYEYSFREIKASERGKGADIGELFKTFHNALGGSNV